MLHYIKIKNLALLKEIELELDSGFTAVTGETGAGKSVLLGALSLLSGRRADKSLIRQGADQLEVEGAVYCADLEKVNGLLEESGLPLCEESTLIVQRRIHRDKMQRIQVNGSMATLAQLQTIGDAWIDFHGPNEPQKLFKERFQLEMLDLYAGNTNRLNKYKNHYKQWRTICEDIRQLKNSEQLTDDERSFLNDQIQQIDLLQPSEASVEKLERDFTRISNAQEFISLASQCSESLLGEQGISDQLNKLTSQYEALVHIDGESAELLERTRSLSIELQDLGEETRRLADNFDFDESSVNNINEKMNLLQELRRKYGGSIETILSNREAMSQKLLTQGDVETLLKDKYALANKLEKELYACASELQKRRESAAESFIEKVEGILLGLGFKNARLEIEFTAEQELKAFGNSRCSLLFSPNAGQTPLPLSKIASSGEIARVMLALKNVLAEADSTPLLVFDEVDANVGGEIGRFLGKELSRLSKCHQIFCVTHLPQVASLANQHFVVDKLQKEGSTFVSIQPIHEDRSKRLDELARMLGNRSSETSKKHAEELLNTST